MTRFSEAVTSLSLIGWHSMFAGKATSDTSRGTYFSQTNTPSSFS